MFLCMTWRAPRLVNTTHGPYNISQPKIRLEPDYRKAIEVFSMTGQELVFVAQSAFGKTFHTRRRV